MELTDGTISITGLDLVRRQVLFDQHDSKRVRWNSLMDAMKKSPKPEHQRNRIGRIEKQCGVLP
jgi:cyanophycinase-like exopeptidase